MNRLIQFVDSSKQLDKSCPSNGRSLCSILSKSKLTISLSSSKWHTSSLNKTFTLFFAVLAQMIFCCTMALAETKEEVAARVEANKVPPNVYKWFDFMI